jgi:CelD/BcsL family acetyltransferase involved in cellulose biosynthesis
MRRSDGPPFELRDDWERLAEASGNIFSTFAWAETWWRHYGGSRRLLVATVPGPGGEASALLPLYLVRERLPRIARFVGHGPADQLGPVCAPEDRPLAAAQLLGRVRRERVDLVLAEQLPGDAPWSSWLDAVEVARSGSPVLRLAGRTWEDVLAARSSNFRQKVKRDERRLAHETDFRFRLSEDPDRLDADLDVLFRLHAARWRDGGSTFLGRDERFHREFARLALDRGWLRLWILELDGTPAGAWLGFRFAGAECYYQSGRDPAFDRYSVGFLLLVHTIRSALADGADTYRFLRGGEDYKYRFADDDPQLATVVFAGTRRGSALARAAPPLARARRLLRAKVL